MQDEYSAENMLAEVNKAIQSICLGGQAYTIGSRSMTRADLGKLYEIRNDLTAQLSGNGGEMMDNCTVAFFEGR